MSQSCCGPHPPDPPQPSPLLLLLLPAWFAIGCTLSPDPQWPAFLLLLLLLLLVSAQTQTDHTRPTRLLHTPLLLLPASRAGGAALQEPTAMLQR